MKFPLDNEWPNDGLERIDACPYCGSAINKLAYGNVQDWAFYCAPGKWNYWECENCQSLYLNPRPTLSTIGAAYAKYFTHGAYETANIGVALKERLKNEWWSYTLKGNIAPRLHLPKWLERAISPIGKRIGVPFGWAVLATSPKKGRFMDVGCGDGQTVKVAEQLGWDAMGIEIDPVAVSSAQKNGLNIIEGTFERLAQYEQQFDCIMCSHVLEHVHTPQDLLDKLKRALKPGGILLLSLPNALSALRIHFGENWRGLEAPRHISIPAEPQLIRMLEELGFKVTSIADNGCETAEPSYRIQRRGLTLNRHDKAKARRLNITPLATPAGNDFIKLICEAPFEM
jgi:2-polyprenyl-3-methyl-5-hydroxy-6-metoxy-1,4-benzoquinol methylase